MTTFSNHTRNALYVYREVVPLKYFILFGSRDKMFPSVTEMSRVNLIPGNRIQNKSMQTHSAANIQGNYISLISFSCYRASYNDK